MCSNRSKEKLTQEILLLKTQQQQYSTTWSNRQTAFDGVVTNLIEMSESIKEEKIESDRRKALEEEDDELPQVGVEGEGEGGAGLDPEAKVFEPTTTTTTTTDVLIIEEEEEKPKGIRGEDEEEDVEMEELNPLEEGEEGLEEGQEME